MQLLVTRWFVSCWLSGSADVLFGVRAVGTCLLVWLVRFVAVDSVCLLVACVCELCCLWLFGLFVIGVYISVLSCWSCFVLLVLRFGVIWWFIVCVGCWIYGVWVLGG